MALSVLAFAPSPTSGQKGPGGIMMLLPWILMLAVVYFLILRPQAKRQKEHLKMIDNLAKGDQIVTSGGIHGKVLRVNDKDGTFVIIVGDDNKLTIDRSAVARIVSQNSSGEKPG